MGWCCRCRGAWEDVSGLSGEVVILNNGSEQVSFLIGRVRSVGEERWGIAQRGQTTCGVFWPDKGEPYGSARSMNSGFGGSVLYTWCIDNIWTYQEAAWMDRGEQ
jgi:hypothetical protein